jgi:hypothetical protein
MLTLLTKKDWWMNNLIKHQAMKIYGEVKV